MRDRKLSGAHDPYRSHPHSSAVQKYAATSAAKYSPAVNIRAGDERRSILPCHPVKQPATARLQQEYDSKTKWIGQ
jgi:hypothetical protein